MAVLTTLEKLRLNNSSRVNKLIDLGARLSKLDSDGSYTGTLATDAGSTTSATFIVDSDSSAAKLKLDTNSATGNYTLSLSPANLTGNRRISFPDATDTVVTLAATQTLTNKTLTAPTIADFTNANHTHADAASGGAIAAAVAVTGTSSNVFDIDSDNTTGVLRIQTTTGGTANTITLTNSTTTADRTITLPDATGTVALLTATQTMTNKTLTAPVINACTITGAVTITTPTVTGTWVNLGSVTTVDINGGTVDGATIGGSSAGAGTFTTLAANTVSAADATTPAITTATGKTNTGYVQVNGKTSGALKLTTADATAYTLTVAAAAQTTGAATLTIPDLGGASSTVAVLGLANAFTAAQSVTVDNATDNAVTDVLTLSHTTSGSAAAGIGVGLAFQIEDAGGSEEQGSIDVALTTATNGSEDADLIVKLNANGDMTEAMRLDASDQSLTIGSNATDADGFNKLRIYANTASKGSVVIAAVANTGDDVLTIQNAAMGQATTLTIPDPGAAAGTFALLQTANAFTAAQSAASDDTTDGVVNLLTLKHTSSDNNATAGDGVGISLHLENATGTSTVEEWASIDAVSTTITDGSEDGDVVVSTMLAGTVTEALRLDASDQSLTLGRNATDANGIHQLRIFPLTASKGSLLINAVAQTGDTLVTIQPAAMGQASVFTIPDPGAATANLVTDSGTNLPYTAPNALAAVNDAAVGIPFVLKFTITSGDPDDSYTVPAGKTLQVLDAWVRKVGTSADGTDTVQLKNGSDAITDVLALNTTDKYKKDFVTIDPAYTTIAAGAALNVDGTNNTDCGCIVYVLACWE